MVNGRINSSHITTTFGLSPYEMVFIQKSQKTIGLKQTHQKTYTDIVDHHKNVFHHPKI